MALSVEVTNWPQRLDPITAVQLLDNLVAIKVTDFLFIVFTLLFISVLQLFRRFLYLFYFVFLCCAFDMQELARSEFVEL